MKSCAFANGTAAIVAASAPMAASTAVAVVILFMVFH
jgi:hypothetical protein